MRVIPREEVVDSVDRREGQVQRVTGGIIRYDQFLDVEPRQFKDFFLHLQQLNAVQQRPSHGSLLDRATSKFCQNGEAREKLHFRDILVPPLPRPIHASHRFRIFAQRVVETRNRRLDVNTLAHFPVTLLLPAWRASGR